MALAYTVPIDVFPSQQPQLPRDDPASVNVVCSFMFFIFEKEVWRRTEKSGEKLDGQNARQTSFHSAPFLRISGTLGVARESHQPASFHQ